MILMVTVTVTGRMTTVSKFQLTTYPMQIDYDISEKNLLLSCNKMPTFFVPYFL